jgi:uncharacterized membrane protein
MPAWSWFVIAAVVVVAIALVVFLAMSTARRRGQSDSRNNLDRSTSEP